jgi:hypothetical protein
MRLQKHIDEYKALETYYNGYIQTLEYLGLNEVTDDVFLKSKELGNKLGFKVARSNSIFDYLKGAGKKINSVYRAASLYLMTDLRDTKSRRDLTADAKKTISSIDSREIMGFLLQLDKASLGITAHIRHIIMSIFGVEITTYNNWVDDITFLKDSIRRMRPVLQRVGTKSEIKILDKLGNMIENT